MNLNERFSYLLGKYADGNINPEEKGELFQLLSTHQFDPLLEQSVQQELTEGKREGSADLPPHVAQEIIRNIFNAEKTTALVLPEKKRALSMGR